MWWFNQPTSLTSQACEAIADQSNEAFVSAASVWEAAIKAASGRLATPTPLEDEAVAGGLVELPVTWRHAVRAAALPLLHRDPFDRMLIAQALEEGLVLITRDPLVLRYDVPTIAA